MGFVYADITIQNSADVVLWQRGTLADKDVRQMNVTALVDTGARTLTINRAIADELDLKVKDQVTIELADGTRGKTDLVGPVDVRFKNRITSCLALVLPNATEVLLGAIPLEGMDLVIDPLLESLDVHPDRPHQALMRV